MAFAVSAALARTVALFCSTEHSRHYLWGIHIEPLTAGVAITATDSHTLGTAHDELGFCDASVTVDVRGLAPALKGEADPTDTRWLLFDGSSVDVVDCPTMLFPADHPLLTKEPRPATGADVLQLHRADALELRYSVRRTAIIDCTYPDYRRCIPSPGLGTTHATYAAGYLTRFVQAAKSLASLSSDMSRKKPEPQLVFTAADDQRKLLIRVVGAPCFLGVLMPIRNEAPWHEPTWLHPKMIPNTAEDPPHDHHTDDAAAGAV